jgi:hypothetical protein
MGDQVVYAKNWQGAGYEVGSDGNAVYNTVGPATEIVTIISGKEPELDSINGDGSNHQVLKSFASSDANESLSSQNFALDTTAYEPGGLYIYFPDASNGGQFYDYEDGKVTVDSSLTADGFYSTSYPTYLLSPSGNNTFWAQQRDGKNTLFTGDENGNNQTQIASLSDYTPYGWYTDDYLLVSQNSSELYVLPAGGGTPLKITDYYKPPINYNGYGGL